MNNLKYSFIIPVYNRPEEIDELLGSFLSLQGDTPFEVVIVEDGSSVDCRSVVEKYKSDLDISYFYKSNSGPGDSRNYGMTRAKGNYFIILDSDCLLPESYLTEVTNYLNNTYVDCYGGPDAAHSSFSDLQKAINFSMTSFITTGGIRGGRVSKEFQPRSFNMGLSKNAFEASGGFGTIHPGEDPDLSIRLTQLGYKTALIKKAYVYHKRRISWKKFYQQIHKFGLVRPILNMWHPQTKKITYWFPTLFVAGFIASVLFNFLGFEYGLYVYALYLVAAFIIALVQTKSFMVSIQSLIAIGIQFYAYGYGFMKSTIAIGILKKDPERHYPKLFFKNV